MNLLDFQTSSSGFCYIPEYSGANNQHSRINEFRKTLVKIHNVNQFDKYQFDLLDIQFFFVFQVDQAFFHLNFFLISTYRNIRT